MFCRNCGKRLDDGDIICPQCGVPVNPTEQAANTTGPSENPSPDNGNNQYNAPNYNSQQYYGNQNYSAPYSNYSSNPYAYKDRSNPIAIIGFILSFFVTVAGLVCSIIGYNRAVKEGLDNKGLALAGIIISAVSMALSFILYFVFYSMLWQYI